VVGFCGYFLDSYHLVDVFKDITYFLKPIICLFLSYLLIRQVNDLFLFLRTIVYVSAFTAFVHLFGLFILGDFRGNSINELRGDFGLDNFIEIFAFYSLLFSNKYLGQWLIERKKVRLFILAFLLASIFLYFSRTMLVVFILIGFSILGYTKITQRTLKFLGVAIVFVSLLYLYLFSIKLERNSKGIEAFLYKIKIAPEEIFTSKIDVEDHKELWDHWRGYEANRALALMENNPSSYIFGNGFGSLVNLKILVPLGEKEMKYISRTHNGYVFVFYKTGIIGLLLYIGFLARLYLKVYEEPASKEKFFSNRILTSIAVFYFFSSLIITGIYIPIDLIVFILGGFLVSTNTAEII